MKRDSNELPEPDPENRDESSPHSESEPKRKLILPTHNAIYYVQLAERVYMAQTCYQRKIAEALVALQAAGAMLCEAQQDLEAEEFYLWLTKGLWQRDGGMPLLIYLRWIAWAEEAKELYHAFVATDLWDQDQILRFFHREDE